MALLQVFIYAFAVRSLVGEMAGEGLVDYKDTAGSVSMMVFVTTSGTTDTLKSALYHWQHACDMQAGRRIPRPRALGMDDSAVMKNGFMIHYNNLGIAEVRCLLHSRMVKHETDFPGTDIDYSVLFASPCPEYKPEPLSYPMLCCFHSKSVIKDCRYRAGFRSLSTHDKDSATFLMLQIWDQ